MRKILLRHRRGVGDVLMLTAGIRDFKLLFPDIGIGVDTPYPDLFIGNPYIDPEITKHTECVEVYNAGYPTIQQCNNGVIHFTMSFLLDIICQVNARSPLPIDVGEFCAAFSNGKVSDKGEDNEVEPFVSYAEKYRKFSDKFARKRADVYLTDKEKSYNLIKDRYGADKYWVVSFGKNDFTSKIWDFRQFQTVVDHYSQYGIKFVIIGRSDHITYKLKNVIDLIDKTTIRDIFPIVYHSDGSISGVSFLMHLAAALPCKDGTYGRPHVALYGGREPLSFTQYEHQTLHAINTIPCCNNNSGCWVSQVVPTGRKEGERTCKNPVSVDGKSVQKCMHYITSNDVIRAISKYYTDMIPIESKVSKIRSCAVKSGTKEINLLASLSSKGGGEQSAVKIYQVLTKAGWKVNFHPWDKKHEMWSDIKTKKSFKGGARIKRGVPLLFYANDQIYDFCKQDITGNLIKHASQVIIGINYTVGPLPSSTWMQKKVSAICFQNTDKMDDFKRKSFWTAPVELILQVGAIDLNKCIEVPLKHRDGDLVVLKHGCPDYRKYTVSESVNSGEKKQLYQKHVYLETDIEFYKRLMNDVNGIRFEFMEAHKELVEAYKDHPQFRFYSFNEIPVTEFLSHGHLYLHRTSRAWCDQYPRSIAEAQAAGLPVLCEPRDGPLNRVRHGVTGMHCIDYDGFLYAVKMLKRKEGFRFKMGEECKRHAKKMYDPENWVTLIERVCHEKEMGN